MTICSVVSCGRVGCRLVLSVSELDAVKVVCFTALNVFTCKEQRIFINFQVEALNIHDEEGF